MKLSRNFIAAIRKQFGVSKVPSNVKALQKAQKDIMDARFSGQYQGDVLNALREISMDLRDREIRCNRKAIALSDSRGY